MSDENYEFLSGLDKTYTGKIRAHVLRRHHDQKQKSQKSTRSVPTSKSNISLPLHDLVAQCDNKGSPCQQLVIQSSAQDGETSDKAIKACSPGRGSQLDHKERDSPFPDPRNDDNRHQSLLVAWSPFDTLPATIPMRDRFLIHHFVKSDASPLYQMDSDRVHFHPTRDICFGWLVHHDVGRIAMAASAAYEVAFNAQGAIGKEALRLETQLMGLLHQRLVQRPPCIDDITVLIVIALISRDSESFVETLDERRQKVLEGHIRGLREIVVRRGGFEKLARSATISFHLHLYDLATAGEISVGLTPLSGYFKIGRDSAHLSPSFSNQDATGNDSNLRDKLIYEFVGFYTSLYQFSRSQSTQPDPAMRMLRLCLSQTFPFNGLLLYEIFRGDIRPVFARLTVLVQLADMLLCLHRSAERKTILSTFNDLGTFIQQQGLNRTPDLWVLSWVLMIRHDTFRVVSPPRLWLTSRILWLAKRSKADFVKHVEKMLFTLLFPDASISFGETASEEGHWQVWDPQDFARLIWAHFKA